MTSIADISAALRTAAETIASASRIVVLTGAGISAESGVPTFRGGGGSAVWRGMPFEQLSSAEMVENDLPLAWEWFDHRRKVVGKCRPNAAHLALAAAGGSGRFSELTVITQNIDGLHAAAGPQRIIELHGNLHEARCLSCGRLEPLSDIDDSDRPPVCPECSDSMRPNVVLFGEPLDQDALLQAYDAAAESDVCIVVGTSAMVYPANQIPSIARREGAFVIEINPEATALAPAADLSIRDRAVAVLPEIFSVT